MLKRIKSLPRRAVALTVAAVMAVGLGAVVTTAMAATTDPNGFTRFGTYNVCWHNSKGTLRRILSTAECRTGEQKIQWFSAGSPGGTGEAGPKGDTGEKGDNGDRGPRGWQGEDGERGPKGNTGNRGPEGPKGDTGDKGDAGSDGEDGQDGVSGYEVFTSVQNFGPGGIGGAWCGAPDANTEDEGWRVIGGGAKLTAADVDAGVQVVSSWPNLGDPLNPGWNVQLNKPTNVNPGDVTLYAVCVKGNHAD
jgi:Collagen triple helix repeat (20 copies)